MTCMLKAPVGLACSWKAPTVSAGANSAWACPCTGSVCNRSWLTCDASAHTLPPTNVQDRTKNNHENEEVHRPWTMQSSPQELGQECVIPTL
mmetsp:Transcript_26850/g.51789  ORF Transcript_26850/g.51789 Transcript_26850/m.51789 type:complete len:92 (+) Transcript_26850:244-519(+)